MYTGYDNYWIYGNRRHEPELYFQKNDNYFSHLAYTNRYKQVQTKGSSNNMYNYVPHPNTVTTSHHNVPNDQHGVTRTQSMLPSLACLQPYPSSLTCQYLPKEVCSAQPNSVPDSCVPLQNQVLRNVQNYNPGQSVNYKSSAGPVNNQESFNYKTHTNSIRVKDFSLLNNNSKNNNCNSLLVSDSHQSQQKRPWYYLHDPPESRQHRMSNGQMQRDHNNYGSSVMVEVNYSYQNYGSTASHNYHISNEEQYSQHSAAMHQHNAQYERQFCYDGLQQGSEKSSQDFSNSSNCPAVQRKNSSRTVTREADKKRRLDAERRSDNNASNCNAFNGFELNEVNPTSQAQFVRSEPTQNALQSPSVSTSHMDPTAKSSSHNSHNEVASFGVTVPGAAQSTPSRDNSTEANRNSDFSSTSSNLVNITVRDCVGDKVSNQKEELDAGEASAGSASSEVSQLDQQEPGCERNEENQNLRKETVAVCNTQTALDLIVIPKVENSGLEKDSLEDERADCREDAKVQTIKSEVGSSEGNENTDNIEDLSDSEETEMPETEDPENINSLLSENPEDRPETHSSALNESQQSDTVILDEMVIELTEDGDEIDSLGGEDRCKSKINRDKLDLLIEFLKEDETEPFEILTITEDDPPPSVTSPQEERPPKKNRRKLSKTSIVRNKNTEREMISLVSYKNPKYSSAKNSSTEETRTVSAKSSECSKDNDFGETVSEEKQPEDDPCDREPQDSVTPEEEEEDRSPTESTCDCSCYGKGITREERTLINIMRAFQNLKSHFCASCAFTSPVESIWINVVSGELRCLNCFKKMFLKAEKNHGSNSKKCRADGPNRLKAAVARKDEEGGGKGNEEGKNLEKKSKCEGQTPAKEAYQREDLKDRVEDEHGMCFENSGDLKKDGSDTVDKRKRETRSDEVETPKRTKSTEERVYEIHQKKGDEEAIDSSAGNRKRSNSAEEFVLRKRPVLEEGEGDMRQNRVIWRERRVSRSRSRDSCSSQKSTTSEEAVEKSRKHESGRTKTSNLTEGCGEKKFLKTKEGKAEHELKRKGHDMLEKPKRKSMTPEEEIDLKKIRNKHSSEKLKVDVENNEIVENWIDESGEKARKNTELKKQSRSPKNPQEDSNKSEKVVSSSGKMKRKRKREKAELRDPPYMPPRKASAEERKPSKMCKRSETVESHSPKIQKKKREHSAPKIDEKTKHSYQKTTGTYEKNPGGKNYKSSKQCLISRLFKGKRCLKVNPSGKYLNKEVHKKEPQRVEERRREKETKENRCHSHPCSMSFHRTVKNSSHKRRHSGEEPTEGKESQHRTWKNGEEARSPSPKSSKEDKRDKAVGDILEGIVNGTEPKSSDSESPLIIRLMKTTTKLSLRLLEET